MNFTVTLTEHSLYTQNSSSFVLLILQYNSTIRRIYTSICTGLFKMIVGVLKTSHTQYTWDRSICVFLFNRTIFQVFVTSLTDALYVNSLWFYKHQHDSRVRSKLSVACQRWWFQWRFWFVPSVPGYLREEEEHKPDPWRNPIEKITWGLHLENEMAVVKTPKFISNNPVFWQYFGIRRMIPIEYHNQSNSILNTSFTEYGVDTLNISYFACTYVVFL